MRNSGRKNAVLKAARREAELLRSPHSGVLGVVIGLKHSRRRGYGTRAKPAIKFLVDRKRQLREDKRLPRRIVFTVNGKRHWIQTDVEEIGNLQFHAVPAINAGANGAGGTGTPGFLLKGGNGRVYLITAGHVLFDQQSVNPWSPPAASVGLNGVFIGNIVPAHTYYRVNPFRFDIGVVQLTNAHALGLLQREPWQSLQRIAGLPTLRAWTRSGSQPAVCRVFGFSTQPLVQLDLLDEDGLDALPGEIYGPVMLMNRAFSSVHRGGNSGGAVVYDGDTLVGIHVLGNSDDPTQGWAITAESIVRQLQARLTTSLQLLTAQGLPL